MSLLRVLGWNPQWATGGRLQEISLSTMNMDFALLAGTQNVSRESAEVKKKSGRVVLEAAVQRGLFTNRSASVSILMGKGFTEKHVHRVFASPPEIWGRCLAARVRRGLLDVCVGVLYFPPQPHSRGARPRYTSTVEKLVQWWRSCMDQLPARCVPIFFADLNDGLGCRKIKGGVAGV